MSRIQLLIGVFTSALFLISGCSKPGVETSQIKQSNLVIEDNVNGRVPPPNNVIESTSFYYNEDGTLNRATVYDDTTTNAHLQKELNLTYFNDKVVIETFLDTVGTITYTVAFNNKKQVTSISLPDSSGLYMSYFNDKISNIKILPGSDEYVNFIYDDNDNLLQYELKINNFIAGRAVLEYDNELIASEFDSKFLTKEVKFIYLGGLDLFAKLGLNTGLSAKNKLVKRTEIALPSSQIFETYEYGYTRNSNADITKRNIRFSTDTLYYQFKY